MAKSSKPKIPKKRPSAAQVAARAAGAARFAALRKAGSPKKRKKNRVIYGSGVNDSAGHQVTPSAGKRKLRSQMRRLRKARLISDDAVDEQMFGVMDGKPKDRTAGLPPPQQRNSPRQNRVTKTKTYVFLA